MKLTKRSLSWIGMLAIIVSVSAVGLSSCDTMRMGLEKEEIEAMQPEAKVFLYSTQHKYARALALSYESMPRCTALSILACSDPDIVEKLRAADLATEAAIKVARADPSNAKIALAVTAYQGLATVLQEYIIRSLLLP